jgi:beta-hydroxylase
MFSRMAPGQKIEPHTGFSKFIQIYHLALKVPQTGPRPYLQVQECDDEEETINCRREEYQWKEGREFIFDDSFTHWTENPNSEERIVLFLHIKRVDYKGWRESLIASVMAYIFSWVPFESVLLLVRGTESTCNAKISNSNSNALTDAQ